MIPLFYPSLTVSLGWYATNPNWRRNTLIAGGALVFIAACIIRQSWKYERRPVPGVRPILSQRFATHTLEDDPQYYDKVSYYKKNGKSFFQRVFPNKEDMEE